MGNKINIVFFGTPEFAVAPVLGALIKNGYNVSRFQPHSLKDERVFEEFKESNPDLCIVAAYGKILPARYLDIPKYGFINVHPSLLPKYRGPSPIQTVILNGDQETGVTLLMVDAKVDHGAILASSKYQIPEDKYFTETAKELFELGAKLLIEILPKYINGEIEPKEQDHSQATFTKMFKREDGKINWHDPAQEIYNRIRALNPEPGTWTTWHPSTSSGQADKVINISDVTTFKVVSPQGGDLVPGTVKKVDNKVVVATSSGYLELISIQLEGGKKMDAKSFINGHPNFLNSQLE